MSYYQTGLSLNTPMRILSQQQRGARMVWKGLSKSQSARSLYRDGARKESGGRPRVSGAKDSIVGFIVDIAHVLLLVGGMWILVTSIASM